jgi:hypothetical protein
VRATCMEKRLLDCYVSIWGDSTPARSSALKFPTFCAQTGASRPLRRHGWRDCKATALPGCPVPLRLRNVYACLRSCRSPLASVCALICPATSLTTQVRRLHTTRPAFFPAVAFDPAHLWWSAYKLSIVLSDPAVNLVLASSVYREQILFPGFAFVWSPGAAAVRRR